ncbi:MAG: LytR/AlgR family response regulator transcription factor [Bacillota bacterium]
MLNVLIVDDNPVEREFLRVLLEEIESAKVVGEAEEGWRALDLATTLNPDIVFLDINMPGVDGVQVAKEIAAAGVKAFIVFVTVETKYAVEAFELDTVDYLLKPFDKARLWKTMVRIKKRLGAQPAAMSQRPAKRNTPKITRLFIRYEGDILAVNVRDIYFVEKDPGKRTIIHTVNAVYQSGRSIAEIERELSGFSNFMRSHKSYLINLEKVERIIPWGDSSYLVRFVNYEKDALISRKNAQLVKSLC